MQLLYPVLLALLALTPPSLAVKKPKDAILLSSVKTLTLRANALTSHRRVSAIPQLTCVGPACKHHTISLMRCTNQGSSYGEEDIEWSCVADMPEEFKLGSTEVVCEGYANRDDPYVLKGSCGVEYRLLLTEKGEEKFGKSGAGWMGSGDGEGGNKFASALFLLIFLGLLFWILYSAWHAIPEGGLARQPRRGWGGGGWGGGGWGGGPDGHDPYDPPPPYPGKRYSTAQQGWRPGFWSGAAAGAAGAYMAGNRANRQQEAPRGSSWFGGNGGTGGFNNSPTSPARSSSGSSSSARHSSTGFGSTSRR